MLDLDRTENTRCLHSTPTKDFRTWVLAPVPSARTARRQILTISIVCSRALAVSVCQVDLHMVSFALWAPTPRDSCACRYSSIPILFLPPMVDVHRHLHEDPHTLTRVAVIHGISKDQIGSLFASGSTASCLHCNIITFLRRACIVNKWFQLKKW